MAHEARRSWPKRFGADEVAHCGAVPSRAGKLASSKPCALPRSSYTEQCRHQKREPQHRRRHLRSKALRAAFITKFRNVEP